LIMDQTDWIQLVIALILVIIAGVLAAAESALQSFSRSRAERLVEQGRPGAARVQQIMEDPPRYLNTALLVRTVFEICSIVLVALVVFGEFQHSWSRILLASVIMIVISYVWWGVAPRTLGRQHADKIASVVAGPLALITAVLGPIPKLLILIGNALTPGKGFREGPFSTEAELRELVDLAEQRGVVGHGCSRVAAGLETEQRKIWFQRRIRGGCAFGCRSLD